MKKECFAYSKNSKHYCSALKYPNCNGCNFYKTKEQYIEELKKLSK